MKKYKVFLSHSSEDGNSAVEIKDECEKIGIEAYIFEHDKQPGKPLADKIKERIRLCDALVVLLTKDGQSSPYVQQEIGAAISLSKPIIPIVENGVEKPRLAMLEGTEYIPLKREDPIPARKTLIEHLGRLVTKHKKETFLVGLLLAVLVIILSVVCSKKDQ